MTNLNALPAEGSVLRFRIKPLMIVPMTELKQKGKRLFALKTFFLKFSRGIKFYALMNMILFFKKSFIWGERLKFFFRQKQAARYF
jgi:hypothetical protein